MTKTFAIKALFIILLVAGIATVAWQQLPRTGVSTDLSTIGQGEPVLVLTRDVNFLNGAQVLELLKPLQAQYAGIVHFRIAHLGQPDGQDFARTHGTQDGDLTLLDAYGEPVDSLRQPEQSEQVVEMLAKLAR